ncbi:MAG: hypothetical protein FWD98_00955 [Defluviitaleaceae bacterium]|nr:hypothetical protein [Defluviitaleaceae bacterium]
MKVLRSKSGITLLFVLGTMMLLLSLGVSALTAAGLAFGARFAKQDRNQLELFVGSSEHTLLAALDNELIPMADSNAPTRIGSFITRDVVYQFFNGVTTAGGDVIIPPAIDPNAYMRHPATINEAGFFPIASRAYEVTPITFNVTAPFVPPNPDGTAVLSQTVTITGTMNVEGSSFVRRHRVPYPNWPDPPFPEMPAPIPPQPLYVTITTGMITASLTTIYTTPRDTMQVVTLITLELGAPIVLQEVMTGSDMYHDTDLPQFNTMAVISAGDWSVIMRGQ